VLSDRFSIELRDARGDVVGREVCRVRPLDERGGTFAVAFDADITADPRARTLVVLVDGTEELRAPVASRRPRVFVDRVQTDSDAVHVEWSVDSELPATFSIVLDLGKGRRVPLASRVTGTRATIPTGNLPQSAAARILVIARDGVRSQEGRSQLVPIAGLAPSCHIFEPPDGYRHPALQPLALSGFAAHLDGARVPDRGLEWSVDGRIVGRNQETVLLDALAPGLHRARLSHPQAEPVEHIFEIDSPTQEYTALIARGIPREFRDREGDGQLKA
jgi:hypothetical protein